MRRACAPTSRHVTSRADFTSWRTSATRPASPSGWRLLHKTKYCADKPGPPPPHPQPAKRPPRRGGSRVNVFTECRHGARRPAELFAQAHGRGPSNIKLRLLHGKTTSDWTKGVRGPPLRERNQLRSRRMSRWAQVGRVDTRTATNYLFKNQTICAIN